jgi:molybdate transport system regulatory protein
MARLTVRIDLEEGAAIGPGKIRLLELIGEHKSIRAAASAMKMSYRRAWLLVRDIESVMGAKVVETETGGRRGGGTVLAPLGRSLIARYRSIERRASVSASAELRALSRVRKA